MIENKHSDDNQEVVSKSLEVTVKVGLVLALLLICFFIVKPFILLILWGVIISVSVHPLYKKFGILLGNRYKLAAIIFTLLLLLILITPITILGSSLVEAVVWIKNTLEAKQNIIPAPTADVKSWPVIGAPLFKLWDEAYQNLAGFAGDHSNQLIDGLKWLLTSLTGAGLSLLLFFASIVISGALLIYSDDIRPVTYTFADRLMGKMGAQAVANATITIRNVIRGILGIAFIQAVLAGLGFMVAGVPGAGLWAFIAFFLCIIQIGPLPIILPVLIFVFVKDTTLTFALLTIWCIPILLIDNILKPILLGRKSPSPMLIVFLGAIGGFIYFGIIGLFVGSVILSLGYNLLLIWLGKNTEEEVITTPEL
jgi:predicted PurR-regulated permease PerM